MASEYPLPTPPEGRQERYYVGHGAGHDALMRCSSCKTLVTTEKLFQEPGTCPKCGTRRFVEIVALSPWEWFKVRVGIIDFPYRKEFLREFQRS